MNVDRLVEQARELRPAATGEAAYQFLSEAPRVLAGLADAVEQLQTWDGLMSLLDEHYPSDVFVGGESSDPGPRIVGLVRELDAERARVAALEAGIAEHRRWVRQRDASGWMHKGTPHQAPNERLWALLDGRVPSTGQETT